MSTLKLLIITLSIVLSSIYAEGKSNKITKENEAKQLSHSKNYSKNQIKNKSNILFLNSGAVDGKNRTGFFSQMRDDSGAESPADEVEERGSATGLNGKF